MNAAMQIVELITKNAKLRPLYYILVLLRGATLKKFSEILLIVLGNPFEITPAKAFCSKGDNL